MTNLSQYAYGDRMRPLVILALKTGMRRGELFDVEWSDIDLTNKVITVKGETAKSSKTRHIPLSPSALEAIRIGANRPPLRIGRVFPR